LEALASFSHHTAPLTPSQNSILEKEEHINHSIEDRKSAEIGGKI